jgi:hypothetical protein
MRRPDPTGTHWNDQEIDLIVADYFDMLRMELSGQSYNKAERNRFLQEQTGRSKGSIEYKHQNISAVLVELDRPWIPGYKPAFNLQGALIEGVDRFLSTQSDQFIEEPEALRPQLAEEAPLYFEQPPEFVKTSDANKTPALRRLVRKWDPVARDARNRKLGEMGEQKVLEFERTRLMGADKQDLAQRVRWVSKEDGDGAGYDILSFDPESGRERLLEVKTTTGHRKTPFFLSENERLVSEERRDAYRLVRLYDFARTPRALELAPPLTDHVALSPTAYRARFS